ncbi:MAG: histidinol dehydrogenase [Saprospiraceae bacterium]|nr:histidinol dehydrogenase [Saprospiraceae bacterium]
MNVYRHPSPDEWPKILSRPQLDTTQLEKSVGDILQTVRREGDRALRKYTAQFDQVDIEAVEVSPEEIAAADGNISASLKEAIDLAHDNIERFHARQLQPAEIVETMPGVKCWRKMVPIEKVGLYIPGGSAPLFSTVLMLGVPARMAGCREVVLCSPPNADRSLHPAILYAAQITGIHRIFRVGGVQAIGAMAYGTESVPGVYKIFGPGNQYVTAAKQMVARDGLAIDMPAGPSEVLVFADDSARPDFAAADLLSQAEHGPDSQVVLVCLEEKFAERVREEIEQQLENLPRKEIAGEALKNSAAVVLKSTDEAVALINAYAPEHLILACRKPNYLADGIYNAGSVFLGHYSPESVGDYASGTNHTLPTGGYARSYSGVSVDSFVKKITYQQLSPEGLKNLGPSVEEMAEAEELIAHKRAISVRLDALKEK